ncbi:tail fibers protein [Escherichia phage BEK3]|nr:tail fibers protein [Escherichia phage BEK2]QGH76808.1 tail fibers protein [Escherichia phage BEK3]
MAIYDLGTASLAANGEVIGVGTTWKAPLTLIRVGATIVFKTEPVQIYTISEIISDTQINVYNPNSETVPAGTGYAILAHDGITVQGLAQDVAETLRYYQSRETEVATAVDVFKDFDQDKFSNDVNQINTQYGEIVTIGAQVSSDAYQVSQDKQSSELSASSASTSAQQAAASAASVSGALIGSFQDGVTIESKTQQIIDIKDGNAASYVWGGELPKVVPANSTVDSTGGIGPTAWIGLTDATLREQIVATSTDNVRQMIREREDAITSNKVRFVTWNNWGAGSISGYFGGDYANRQRIVDINTWWLRIGADFVGGQESYTVPNLRASELALYPYGSGFQSTSEWFSFGRNYGNMVASTRPLTNVTGSRFLSQPTVGDTEYRSYVRAEMKVNGTTVVVYNTHLALSQERISAMITELASMAAAETHSHVVLMGDWNTNNDSDFQPFIDAGFTMVNRNGEINTSNNGGTWYLDRIFHKGFSEQGEYGSVDTPLAIGDHKPLYVDLTI